MKKLIAMLCCALLAAPSFAVTQDKGKAEDRKAAGAKKEPTEKQKAQQERMKTCNDKASDKKGIERKNFMNSCLKGEEPGATVKQKAQQNKMTDCNKQAADKKLKGDERKGFMSSCLKG